MNIPSPNTQKGFSLTEALIAFVVVVAGLLATASFQVGLFGSSSYNKARTEALSLAQQKIEEFKGYTLADETNYIDDDNDGVMDVDGTYTENPINGQNAVFTRGWDLATADEGKEIDVSVSWVDADNQTNTVILGTTVPWLSPRSGADQLTELEDPLVPSPTGRARLGDGNLSDYDQGDVVQVKTPGADGLSTYRHDEDLFLVDGNDNILLTLEEVCDTTTGVCTDFAKISGKVYLDTANTNDDLADIFLLSSDAAYCQRFVMSGSLQNPPATANGDYEYFQYTCYVGGGWHGNIGFVTSSGLSQSDKICQGDPTSLNAWEQPEISLRRAYRGMLSHTYNGETVYTSHGIKDAAELTGHDFVFTRLQPNATAGSNCIGTDAPMTRADSSAGSLFAGVPVDFVCLNADYDDDAAPDYLDDFDTSLYSVDVTCPYDPTDPPVSSHFISGVLNVDTGDEQLLDGLDVVTSDGIGNCKISDYEKSGSAFVAKYACLVYDWGTGWSGYVQIRPASVNLYCPTDTANYTSITGDQTHDFSCFSIGTVTISGAIDVQSRRDTVSAIAIYDGAKSYSGSCSTTVTSYECRLPYDGSNVDVLLNVTSGGVVCGSVEGAFEYSALNSEASPYAQDIVVQKNSNQCP